MYGIVMIPKDKKFKVGDVVVCKSGYGWNKSYPASRGEPVKITGVNPLLTFSEEDGGGYLWDATRFELYDIDAEIAELEAKLAAKREEQAKRNAIKVDVELSVEDARHLYKIYNNFSIKNEALGRLMRQIIDGVVDKI